MAFLLNCAKGILIGSGAILPGQAEDTQPGVGHPVHHRAVAHGGGRRGRLPGAAHRARSGQVLATHHAVHAQLQPERLPAGGMAGMAARFLRPTGPAHLAGRPKRESPCQEPGTQTVERGEQLAQLRAGRGGVRHRVPVLHLHPARLREDERGLHRGHPAEVPPAGGRDYHRHQERHEQVLPRAGTHRPHRRHPVCHRFLHRGAAPRRGTGAAHGSIEPHPLHAGPGLHSRPAAGAAANSWARPRG